MPDSKPSRPRAFLIWWILALALVPTLGAAGWALLALSRHPANASDQAAAAALLRVAPAVVQTLESQAEQLARLGSVIARDPKFYAVLTLPSASRGSSEYRDALQGVLREFQREADVPVFAVTDPRGKLLGRAEEPASGAVDLSDAPFVHAALRGSGGTGYLVERDRIYRVAAVPISAGGVLVGTLTLGRPVDEVSGRLKAAMEADLTLTVERSIAATTLAPSPLRKALAERLAEGALAMSGPAGSAPSAGDAPGTRGEASPAAPVIQAGGRRYLALRRSLEEPLVGRKGLGYVLTRPLTLEASPLATLERDLVRAAGLGLALALVCGGIMAFAVRRELRARERAHAGEALEWAEVERHRSALLAVVGARVLDPAETVFTITDLVADGALGELTMPQREGMLAIRRASRDLTRLARDLSTLASLEREDVALSPASVDVGNLVEQAATLLIPLASERRQMVELSAEPGLTLPAVDESHFKRVVEALALGMIERAPDGTKIELMARRWTGGIEVALAGDPEDRKGGRYSPVEDLAAVMADRFAKRHRGSFHVATEERFAYRLWLPLEARVLDSGEQCGKPTEVSGSAARAPEPSSDAAEPGVPADPSDHPTDPARAA